MIEDMQVRNLAPLTQITYLQQVSRFARHFGQSPEQLGQEDIRAYRVLDGTASPSVTVGRPGVVVSGVYPLNRRA
jgi:hypothetical protein